MYLNVVKIWAFLVVYFGESPPSNQNFVQLQKVFKLKLKIAMTSRCYFVFKLALIDKFHYLGYIMYAGWFESIPDNRTVNLTNQNNSYM